MTGTPLPFERAAESRCSCSAGRPCRLCRVFLGGWVGEASHLRDRGAQVAVPRAAPGRVASGSPPPVGGPGAERTGGVDPGR